MIATQMAQYFEMLQDKSSSSYFTPAEISLFLQRASIEFVKEHLPTDDSRLNIELSQDTLSNLSPLVFKLPQITMPSGGVVTKQSVQTALTGISAQGILWRPLSIGWELAGSKRPVKFARHNDNWAFYPNFFKRPSNEKPIFIETASDYIIEPATANAKLTFTVLKYPALIDVVAPVNSDLPDHTHDKIIAIALELAGVSSRDVALAQLLQLKNNA